MSDKPITSEVSVEANSDKMARRAAELGIPYDAARAIYSEAFRDGFGNYDALRDQLDEYVRVVGEQQSQVETLKAENERLDGLAALESANAASYLARAEKAEAERDELRAKFDALLRLCPNDVMEKFCTGAAKPEPEKEGR